MADTKISALPAAAALSGGEKIPAVQSGANVALTPNQIAAFLNGRNWYVANAGSDANNGQSAAAPFQTLAKVRTVMATGDRVLLRCGSSFRESFDISALGGVTVGSYGGGARPVIDGADIVTETWTFVSGNVYRVLITIPEGNASANRGYPGIFENGTLLAEFDNSIDALGNTAARVAAVQSKPGSFNLESPSAYASGWSAGATFSYLVQASDGGNPASNGKLYEVRKRLYTITHAGALISGITFRRQLHHDGATLLYNSTLPGKWTNCLFDQMPRHHTIDSLSDYEDCLATRPNPKYPGSYMFHAYGPAGQGNTKRYRRCKAIGDFATTTAGFGTHSSVGGTACQARIIYEDCENVGTTGFSGYDFTAGDYIRPKNRDCIQDFGANPIAARIIDGDFLGASGSCSIAVPAAGATLTLIRTRAVGMGKQGFFYSTAAGGSIDIQEGCELLWEGKGVAPAAFICLNGAYAMTSFKARRSIMGAIGGAKSLFSFSTGAGIASYDVDDCTIGGFLSTAGGTQNTMVAQLLATTSGGTAALTAGIGSAVRLMADLRKMYVSDPIREGTAKRTGANWPLFAGFNASSYPPSGGGTQVLVGKTTVQAFSGYKTGGVTDSPASELFAVLYITGSIVIACGANGLIRRSTNGGATWATVAGGTTNTLRAIGFAGATVLIVGDGGVEVRSTDSGATFATNAAPAGATDLLAVTYANSRFVAVGAGGWTQWSTDGSSGTFTRVQVSTATWRSIAFSSTTFVMVGDNQIGRSTTGSGAWSTISNVAAGTYTNLRSIACDGTNFVAVGISPGELGPDVITSADGISWSQSYLDLPFDALWVVPPAVETNRWAIGGKSNFTAFFTAPNGAGARLEAMTPTDTVALTAIRTGTEGWLAAA